MKFNYNDGGRKEAGYKGTTGDCVCRSIAIALDKPYKEVYNELINVSMSLGDKGKKSHPRTGIYKKVYHKYLKDNGWEWIPTMKIGSGCRVHLKDGELPMGNLVVRLSKHLTAVIDGIINDTFDCSREGTRCVYGYFIKKQ